MNVTNKKTFLAAILAGLLLAGLLPGCSGTSGGLPDTIPEKDRLVVYTAHKEEIYKPIIREFEERSGIWVDVVSGSTNEMLSRIEAEAGNVNADIMFGGGVDSLQAYENFFEPYITDKEELLDSTYASASHSYTVFSKLPVVFVYNTKLVLKAEAPGTWESLLDPAWKGRIAFTDPEKSGSAYTELTVSRVLEEAFSEGSVFSLRVLFMVLHSWDSASEDAVLRLGSAGIPVIVYLVTDGTDSLEIEHISGNASVIRIPVDKSLAEVI